MSKYDMMLHRDCGLHLTAAAEEINRERSHVYLQRGTDKQLRIIRAVSLQSASYALDDWKIGVLLPAGLDIILLDIVFRRSLQSTQFPTESPFRGIKLPTFDAKHSPPSSTMSPSVYVLLHTLRKSGVLLPQGSQVS